MADSPSTGLSPEGHEHLLRQVFELWAEPEVRRRQEAGEMPRPAQVHAVQVLLRVDAAPEVRLNEEVRGVARATAGRSVEAGDLVAYEDVESLIEFSLEAADDANAGHITAIALPAGWAVLFDVRYNAERVAEHRASADEFLAAAADALARGHLRAFAEVAFAAVELLAKAELLSRPDKRLLTNKRHGFVASEYNQHVRLGNTDARFAATLNSLSDLRAAARYLRAPLALDPDRAREILELLREMRSHVEQVSPDWPRPAVDGAGPSRRTSRRDRTSRSSPVRKSTAG